MLRTLGGALTSFLVGAASLFLAAAGLDAPARGALAGRLSSELGRFLQRTEARAPAEPDATKAAPEVSDFAALPPTFAQLPPLPSETRGLASALDGLDALDVKPGEPLGTGSDKITYALDDDHALSVVDRRPGKTLAQEFDVLARESSQLRLLAEHGIPVVEIVKYGTFDGHAAVVTRRYATAMKAPDFEKTGYRFLNERSFRDLEHIRKTLADNKIVVRDLQFLVGKDGRVVVADPLRIFGTESDSPRIPGFKALTRLHETPRNLKYMVDMTNRAIAERDAELPR